MFLKSCFLNYLSEVFWFSKGLHSIYKIPTGTRFIKDLYNNRVDRAKVIKRVLSFLSKRDWTKVLNSTAQSVPQSVISPGEALFGKLLILL